jgi:putative flippase GtrA
VDFAVMIACVSIGGLMPAAGTAIGAASGGVTNFLLGRHWIFKPAPDAITLQASRYALVSFASLLLNTAGEHALAGVAHVQYVAARFAVAITVSIFWNFPMQRSFVYKASAG